MLFITGIVLLIAAAVGIKVTRGDKGWPFAVGIFAFILTMLAWLMPVALIPTGTRGNPSPNTMIGTSSLIALGTDSETSGSFFLGTGSVDEEPVFAYISETDLGAEMLTVPTDRARIVEEEGEPHIAHWKFCNQGFWLPWMQCGKTLYVFHIPPGSITRDFTIAP